MSDIFRPTKVLWPSLSTPPPVCDFLRFPRMPLDNIHIITGFWYSLVCIQNYSDIMIHCVFIIYRMRVTPTGCKQSWSRTACWSFSTHVVPETGPCNSGSRHWTQHFRRLPSLRYNGTRWNKTQHQRLFLELMSCWLKNRLQDLKLTWTVPLINQSNCSL